MSGKDQTREDILRDRVQRIIKIGVTKEELTHEYDEWGDKYDQDLLGTGYKGPDLAADTLIHYLDKYDFPRDCKIIDIAAGTGLVAKPVYEPPLTACIHRFNLKPVFSQLFEKYGCSNLCALDGSSGMLNVAKETGFYKKLIHTFIGEIDSIPEPDDSYDAAVLSGALYPGHLTLDNFIEIMRIIKPGGLIINVTRDEYHQKGGFLEHLDKTCDAWVQQGKIEILEIRATDKPYVSWKNKALIMVFKVL